MSPWTYGNENYNDLGLLRWAIWLDNHQLVTHWQRLHYRPGIGDAFFAVINDLGINILVTPGIDEKLIPKNLKQQPPYYLGRTPQTTFEPLLVRHSAGEDEISELFNKLPLVLPSAQNLLTFLNQQCPEDYPTKSPRQGDRKTYNYLLATQGHRKP